MSSQVDWDNIVRSAGWGAVRGGLVETFVYPLEVVKIRQQCAKESKISLFIAKQIWKEEGFFAFYQGLSPQLVKTGLRQIWCWPMITELPRIFRTYHFGDVAQQILTGFSIATVDAAITNPLERAKIFSALTGKIPFSLSNVYKEGWRGISSYWIKRAVTMATFLAAQRHFREQSRKQSGVQGPLEIMTIGIKAAIIVSLVSAPFDMANTLHQAKNLGPSYLFTRQGLGTLYRGWPLYALSLVIHNVASAFVLEKLSK